MEEEKVNQYLRKIPSPIIKMVTSLDSKSKWAVFIALLENNQMYFNQIKDEFEANSSEIDRILKGLCESGLVIKRAKNFSDVKNNNRTYYQPTYEGAMFYESMFDLIIPKKISPSYTSDVSSFNQSSLLHLENLQSIVQPEYGMSSGGIPNE